MAVAPRELLGTPREALQREPATPAEILLFPNIVTNFGVEPLTLKTTIKGVEYTANALAVGRRFDRIERGLDGQAMVKITEYFSSTGSYDPVFRFGTPHFNGFSEHAEMVRSRSVTLAEAKQMAFSSRAPEPEEPTKEQPKSSEPAPKAPESLWHKMAQTAPDFR